MGDLTDPSKLFVWSLPFYDPALNIEVNIKGSYLGGIATSDIPSGTLANVVNCDGGYCSSDPSNETCYSWYCYTPESSWSETPARSGLYDVGFGCIDNKGASGGPVFEPYNGSWYVASVNSHTPNGNTIFMSDGATPWYAKNMWGPYFNQGTLDLLAYLEGS